MEWLPELSWERWRPEIPPQQGREVPQERKLRQTSSVGEQELANIVLRQQENLVNMLASLGVNPVEAQHGVAGRLANHVGNWEKITQDRWILDTVRGY